MDTAFLGILLKNRLPDSNYLVQFSLKKYIFLKELRKKSVLKLEVGLLVFQYKSQHNSVKTNSSPSSPQMKNLSIVFHLTTNTKFSYSQLTFLLKICVASLRPVTNILPWKKYTILPLTAKLTI